MTPDVPSGCPCSVGDVVQLRSGGPAMTVERIASDETVACTWIFSGKENRGEFPVKCLMDVPAR